MPRRTGPCAKRQLSHLVPPLFGHAKGPLNGAMKDDGPRQHRFLRAAAVRPQGNVNPVSADESFLHDIVFGVGIGAAFQTETFEDFLHIRIQAR